MLDDEYWHDHDAMFDAIFRVQPPSTSDEIESLEEASAYWRENFSGAAKPVSIRYRGKQYLIHVAFVTDHAYTMKNPEWTEGKSNVRRVLDLPRAKAMDNIWKVLQTPDAITWSRTTEENKQYDTALSAEDRMYGRVILAPTPTKEDLSKNECTHFEFVSWHLPDYAQHAGSLRRDDREKTNPVQLPPSLRRSR